MLKVKGTWRAVRPGVERLTIVQAGRCPRVRRWVLYRKPQGDYRVKMAVKGLEGPEIARGMGKEQGERAGVQPLAMVGKPWLWGQKLKA